jgi:hypothetical protein
MPIRSDEQLISPACIMALFVQNGSQVSTYFCKTYPQIPHSLYGRNPAQRTVQLENLNAHIDTPEAPLSTIIDQARPWLTPVILATQEVVIRRISV